MNTDTTKKELDEKIQARFRELPKVIQNAITSADVQKKLRQLADTRNLHLDQWQLLENNVMLTLLGYQPPGELTGNLKSDLEISDEVANSLAADVSRVVFEPIRQELERELGHPEAKEKQISRVEAARESILQAAAPSTAVTAKPAAPAPISQSPPPAVQPATPPAPAPAEKAVRAPSSGSYKHGEASTARKDIHDDPYREPPA